MNTSTRYGLMILPPTRWVIGAKTRRQPRGGGICAISGSGTAVLARWSGVRLTVAIGGALRNCDELVIYHHFEVKKVIDCIRLRGIPATRQFKRNSRNMSN